MSLRYPFVEKRSEDLKGAADRIKIWTREALSLSDDAAVTVSEINCHDPACPGVETVILVMLPGLREPDDPHCLLPWPRFASPISRPPLMNLQKPKHASSRHLGTARKAKGPQKYRCPSLIVSLEP